MFHFAASVCQDCQLTEGYLQSLVTVDSNVVYVVPVVHLSVIPKMTSKHKLADNSVD